MLQMLALISTLSQQQLSSTTKLCSKTGLLVITKQLA
jgi:hypothetical protein